MKLSFLFLGLLVALVTAVAIPEPENGMSTLTTHPTWLPSLTKPKPMFLILDSHAEETGPVLAPSTAKKATASSTCLKDKDCSKYMKCSDTHCFPHSNNDRRDSEDSTGSDVADADSNAVTYNEYPDEATVVPDAQFHAPCVNNSNCSSNETGRCWESGDCNRRQHCINTFCYPPNLKSRRDSVDGIGIDQNDDVTELDQEDTLLDLVAREENIRYNKCRRGCNTSNDCCRGDDCWGRVCLGPHRGG
ncbi:uncharacterized protein KD926_006840 [Aspergillus affinis]|uniref:uncharacterized protein n=1 Tax=Aspergillus affinis TaxID=1070780 RepID=UPI0022FDEE79|nr:uncharacterized protein KD926_006840 [Aspergillus affinis]KAI9041444.1 hypothetical protein KD926_006840 [Aspergillus affinis]